MKSLKILSIFLLLICGNSLNVFGQLLTESFETDGEGVRYTSNFFQSGCSDFFERIQGSDIPTNNCVTTAPTGQDGTFYWGGEDTDQASGGEGVLTLNAVAVTGFNLDVDVLLAFGRPDEGRCESSDYFILEYNMDGAGWNIFGAMYGNNAVAPFTGNLQLDTDLDGVANVGAIEVNSTDFQNFNFTIPVTGNSVQVRFRLLMDQGTEETTIDNIRINGTSFLPVEMVNFQAEKLENEKAVSLHWKTASEINNEGFDVLHSVDGENWTIIDFIDGVGTTTEMTTYEFVHRSPSSGLNYYRLKQIDFDGKSELSQIRSVGFDVAKDLRIIPNPAEEVFNVSINKEVFQDEVSVEVMDAMGGMVFFKGISIETNNVLQIDALGLQKGVYFVHVFDQSTTKVKRVVIK